MNIAKKFLVAGWILLIMFLPIIGHSQGSIQENGGGGSEKPQLSCRNFNWGACARECSRQNVESGGRGCTSMCSRQQSDCDRALNQRAPNPRQAGQAQASNPHQTGQAQAPNPRQTSQAEWARDRRDRLLSHCATISARCENACDGPRQDLKSLRACQRICQAGLSNCQSKAF